MSIGGPPIFCSRHFFSHVVFCIRHFGASDSALSPSSGFSTSLHYGHAVC